MKKVGVIAVLVLLASTLVLLVMLVMRAIQNQNQLKLLQLTQTAAEITQAAEQTLAAIPTETPEPTITPTPEPSPTPEPPTPTSEPTATEELTVIEGCDVAAFVADVTIPDNQVFDPDQKFTKTWRLLNDGTCTWNSYYQLYFVSGDQMSGPTSQQLTAVEVPPGASIDVSVDLKSPKEAGTYTGYWGIKNTNGLKFGIGPAGEAFYVKIKVVE